MSAVFTLAVALLAGLPWMGVDAAEVVVVTLKPTTRNAGQIGRAFLLPEGAKTRIQIEVSGVPPLLSSRPVHLYTYVYAGTCDRRSAEPAFALLDRVLAQPLTSAGTLRGPFTISNNAPLPLDLLRAKPFAIVVRTSPADGSVDLYCGDVSP